MIRPFKTVAAWAVALCAVGMLGTVDIARANVSPPLDLQVDTVAAPSSDARVDLRIAVQVPSYGGKETQIRLLLQPEGAVRLLGSNTWAVSSVVPGQNYTFAAAAEVSGPGIARVKITATSFDASDRKLWSKVEEVYLKKATAGGGVLVSRSSPLEVQRRDLQQQLATNKLGAVGYSRELRRFTESVAPQARAAEGASPDAIVDNVVVSGTAKYTQRTAAAVGSNTFAAAAAARAIQGARVEFYDDKAGVQTLLTSNPAAVVTGTNGSYSATVAGKRADGTAVQLVVKVAAATTAATIGPIGVGANAALAYKAASAPVLVDAAAKTVDVLVNNANANLLGAFALREGLMTAYTFVVALNARTGVGVAPSTIYVEYPGNNATGSFFSTNSGDHLNIGLNHGFDWDVYTHEYGHYVQKINGTTQNPGGPHSICGSATGTGGRSKDQGLKLAWGEGWPTFFGTNLQIDSGAGAFGIFGVGDTVYTDTANNFHYDLEANSDLCAGAGEDSELSVQRILWDFADQPQDGNDSVTFGTDVMWQRLVGGTKPVTLDQFRALFDTLVPGSPASYNTGSLNQNRVKYGRIYADHNVGPVPLTPAENYAGAAPNFSWSTKGAGGPPSYRFNKFKVVVFNKDYSSIVFTSPEIPTAAGSVAANGLTASWTPTAAEWTTIQAGDKLMHWVVQGSSDTTAPATGPYFGQDRTLGALSLVFVIDDTGSMTNDIAGVRLGLTNFITALRAMNLPNSPNIEVITFKDNVTRRIVSNDPAQIQTVVNSLSASGGGDCPESSAEALLEAANDLPASGSGGTIIFATDASPHAGFNLAGIQAKMRAKGIAITELLTGDCSPGGGVGRIASSGRAAAAIATSLGITPPSSSMSANPGFLANRRAPSGLLWPEDVLCPDCNNGVDTGPALSPNVLKLVGDSSLTVPSSIASFAAVANASPRGTLLYLPEVKSGDITAFSAALTNAALGAIAPAVVSSSPIIGYPGSTLDVVLTGSSTNFNAASTVSFGSGITVNSIAVVASTKLQVNITIAANAALGARDVVVTSPLGAGVVERTIGTAQFAVGSTTVALLESLLPYQVARNSTQTLQVYGVNTHFTSATLVTVAATGVTVGAVAVESPTKLRVQITVGPTATLGFAVFRAVTGGEFATFGSGLLVVDSIDPPPTLPVLSAISPSSGVRGSSSVDISVTGSNTHFINGETLAAFSGDGITVQSTTVTGATQATVRINISATATLGFRDLLLLTNGETAVRVAGFQVLGALVCDLNADGKIDRTDLDGIVALRNQPASANPLADANGDGIINVLDVRVCTARCTNAACAP